MAQTECNDKCDEMVREHGVQATPNHTTVRQGVVLTEFSPPLGASNDPSV